MTPKYFQFIVKDKVQDVGFRLAIAKLLPDSLDVRVDNLEDGSVRVVLRGEEKEVREFYERLKRGTLGKSVNPEFVNLTQVEGDGISTDRFFHKLQCEQMEKFVDVGFEMKGSMDGMKGSMDEMKGSMVEMKGSVDEMSKDIKSLPENLAKELVELKKKGLF